MSERTFVISGGKLVTPSGLVEGDLFVEEGKIAAVGGGPFPELAPRVDARGLFILPGGVDAHVHLAMRSDPYHTSDDFASGSLAALRGGTTAVVDFVEPEPGEKLVAALDRRLAEAASAAVDVKLHMTISEWRDSTSDEMRACVERGVDSFKIYLAYLDSIGLGDEDALRVLGRARDLGAKVLVHAESGPAVSDLGRAFSQAGRLSPKYHALSRPPECEAAAIAKIAGFVRRLGGSRGPRVVIAHVSSELGMREILEAKREGLPLLAETCPHYLAFTEERYQASSAQASRFVMSPPLRRAADVSFLWSCVADGGIDFVSTDHCPFDSGDKEGASDDFTRIPNGVGGIAERVAYLLTEGYGRRGIPLERLSALLCSSAGTLHGFSGHSIVPGEKADLCLWRLGESYDYSRLMGASRCDYSVYEGMRFSARPERVYADGFLASSDWKTISRRQGAGGA